MGFFSFSFIISLNTNLKMQLMVEYSINKTNQF